MTQAALWKMDCGGQGVTMEPGRPAGMFLQSLQRRLNRCSINMGWFLMKTSMPSRPRVPELTSWSFLWGKARFRMWYDNSKFFDVRKCASLVVWTQELSLSRVNPERILPLAHVLWSNCPSWLCLWGVGSGKKVAAVLRNCWILALMRPGTGGRGRDWGGRGRVWEERGNADKHGEGQGMWLQPLDGGRLHRPFLLFFWVLGIQQLGCESFFPCVKPRVFNG